MFLYSHWLQLPISTRIKLADHFGIVKSGPTHVADNQVVSDGYLIKDVEKMLNTKAIQNYLGSKEDDVEKLWALMVDRIEGRFVATPIVNIPNVEVQIPQVAIPTELVKPIVEVSPITVPIKKRGRPFKNKPNGEQN